MSRRERLTHYKSSWTRARIVISAPCSIRSALGKTRREKQMRYTFEEEEPKKPEETEEEELEEEDEW